MKTVGSVSITEWGFNWSATLKQKNTHTQTTGKILVNNKYK